MPPNKGQNSKKEAGRAKKAENEAKKKDAASAEKEKKVAEKWNDGAKDTRAKEEKEEKRKADAARKAENARLLAEEEASVPKVKKPVNKTSQKKSTNVPAGPGAIAATAGASGSSSIPDSAPAPEDDGPDLNEPAESFAATGIDDALDLLSIVNQKTDKASVGQQAAGIEKHPERRFKAAFEAYLERELPEIKVEHPGLRLNQYRDLLFKQFQKAPENPFNQTTVDYNASKDERVAALNKQKREISDRLRQKE